MRDALLTREDSNVILTDWSGGAFESYGQSTGNARLVGAQIAELIKFIIKRNGDSKDLANRLSHWVQPWSSNYWLCRESSSPRGNEAQPHHR